jgi:hypothetical protein
MPQSAKSRLIGERLLPADLPMARRAKTWQG